MELALTILLWPVFISGMYKMPLDAVMERFKSIRPQDPDSSYEYILKQMRAHGMALPEAVSRIQRERRNNALEEFRREWGVAHRTLRQVQACVEITRAQAKEGELLIESHGQLPLSLIQYISDSFVHNKCKGGLVVCYEPDSNSLMRLDDDVHVKGGAHKTCDYSQHRLVFNREFLALNEQAQQGFIEHCMGKIVEGHALWGRMLKATIKSRKANAAEISQSSSMRAYRTYLMLSADARRACESVEGAAQIEAMYDVYADAYASRGDDDEPHAFYASYKECSESAKRLHRFMQIDTRRKQAQQ